jgi:pimeloyl-ACP methyl ester carboxylesterase
MRLSESHFVTADDGVDLYIRIKGKVGRPPVLYLHGGPGSGLNLAAFETYAGPMLEPYFPVAYLHQRGVLRSRGSGSIRQNISHHINDIRAVVTFLCRRFQEQKVDLLAHSWGAFAACAYLSRYAPMVSRLVAISPVISIHPIQQELYKVVSEHLAAGDDSLAGLELADIGPPPYPDIDDFIRLQGLASEFWGDPYRYIDTRELEQHTGYDLDVEQCLGVQTQIAQMLWPDLYRQDLTATTERFTSPLMMLACDRDSAVPWTAVRKAFEAYARRHRGVEKKWLLMERCNHLPFTEPNMGKPCLDPVIAFLTDDST